MLANTQGTVTKHTCTICWFVIYKIDILLKYDHTMLSCHMNPINGGILPCFLIYSLNVKSNTMMMLPMEQEPLTFPKHPRVTSGFYGVVLLNLGFYWVLCRWLFVLLSSSFYSMYYLSFIDLQLLIIPLVYTNFV